MKNLNTLDKIFSTLLLFCLLFWILAKIPVAFDFIPFDIFYHVAWLIVALFTIICTIYFFYKWFKNGFSFAQIHLYVFLVGIITLLIMRFL
jgi:hypothetical protein